MPIYEYQCQLCGYQHEALQKMSADVLIDCPECNKLGLKKKISAVGFRLKGSGWYETDFKNSGKKPSEPKDSRGGSKAIKPTKSSNSAGGCGHSH